MIARRAMMGLLGASGGGGGDVTDRLVLLHKESMGYVQTTNTSATSTGYSFTLSDDALQGYTMLLVAVTRDAVAPSSHIATYSIVFIGKNASGGNSTTAVSGGCLQVKANSNTELFSAASSSLIGVYANTAVKDNNGNIICTIYKKYNSSTTSTIDGNYTCRVYGIKLYDLIGG